MIDMVEKRLDVICPSFFAAVFVEKESFAHSEMWDALLLMTKSKKRNKKYICIFYYHLLT
jgi:hypothetical protein